MTIREFAFVIDGDVFALVKIDEDAGNSAQGLIAGLQSGPEIIEVTGQEVKGMFNLTEAAFHQPE